MKRTARMFWRNYWWAVVAALSFAAVGVWGCAPRDGVPGMERSAADERRQVEYGTIGNRRVAVVHVFRIETWAEPE